MFARLVLVRHVNYFRVRSLDSGVVLLLPSLSVHAHHEEPQGQRSFSDDARDDKVGEEQTTSEWRPGNVR
jgi:hypothetical protein